MNVESGEVVKATEKTMDSRKLSVWIAGVKAAAAELL